MNLLFLQSPPTQPSNRSFQSRPRLRFSGLAQGARGCTKAGEDAAAAGAEPSGKGESGGRKLRDLEGLVRSEEVPERACNEHVA